LKSRSSYIFDSLSASKMDPSLNQSSQRASDSTPPSKGSEVPELIYHTMLTVIDNSQAAGPDNRKMYPLQVHADLPAAKSFARDALRSLGYDKSDFQYYRTREESENLSGSSDENLPPLEDGVLVHARREGPHDFIVGIVPTFNVEGLPRDPSNLSELKLPNGTDRLHYVIQEKTDYNADRSGAAQTLDVEGVYIHRSDAYVAAKNCLLGDSVEPNDFVEYDVRDDTSFADEWPYGEDVVVHAVLPTGENLKVSVLTTLRTQELHGKNHKVRW
jgi:hypothetical protein